MALLVIPFKPSYTALKNLRQKVQKYIITALVNLTLPIQPQDLSTDVNPYIDNTIGILSNSTSHLYNDNAPWVIHIMEVKKGIKRVNVKVDKIKTKVTKIKIKIAEIKTRMRLIKVY